MGESDSQWTSCRRTGSEREAFIGRELSSAAPLSHGPRQRMCYAALGLTSFERVTSSRMAALGLAEGESFVG
jgi:hypothetical protein